MLPISTRCHFGSDDETATISKIYDADFPLRESIREIHSHGQTPGRSFQSAGIYQSSKLLFSPFSVIVASPLPVRRRPFAVSRPPSTHPLFPSSPKRVLETPPENMHHTNKTTQAAQRISMLFLSYRRATNERTIHPSSVPFFSNHCVLSVEQAPPVSMLSAT